MKKIFITVAILFALFSFKQSNAKSFACCITTSIDTASISARCISKTDAGKILGQTCHRTEMSSDSKNGTLNYRCTYTADSVNPKTGKTGNLYYLFQLYPDIASAQRVYNDIVSDNKDMPGFKSIANIGDEALLHTDNVNFYLVMVRKGSRIIRMKINKITAKTSTKQLMSVTKAITAKL